MGADIIIPLVILAIVIPAAFWWARTRLKESPTSEADSLPPTGRLTSTALRELESPPWRVVYEIPEEKLGGIAHVLIGTPGVYAMQTNMDPLPAAVDGAPDPQTIGRSAIARGALDDALARCGLASDRLVVVHWGRTDADAPSVDVVPGRTAVDGHRLTDWAASLGPDVLTGGQVDLAWQAVVTAIGRPDPLA